MKKSTSKRVRKCRECDIYYRPGVTHCDCGASHFPLLPLELQR
jgi:hypothetical protein